jgi:hypothetical protein
MREVSDRLKIREGVCIIYKTTLKEMSVMHSKKNLNKFKSNVLVAIYGSCCYLDLALVTVMCIILTMGKLLA